MELYIHYNNSSVGKQCLIINDDQNPVRFLGCDIRYGVNNSQDLVNVVLYEYLQTC